MLLEVEDLTAGYGDAVVVREVNLDVERGEVVAILGLNGAGKTTLIKTLGGLIKAVGGRIRLESSDITHLSAYEKAKAGVTLVTGNLFPDLSVKENLQMGIYAQRSKKGSQDKLEAILRLFPVLRDRFSQGAGTLSGGERRMLCLARGLVSNPKVLILDEPSAGLAPVIVSKLVDAIRQIRKEGQTILLIEQNIPITLSLAERAYILYDGRVVSHSKTSDMDPNTVKKMFGL
jgi:branched-chain amino acid transport system ATP-binding protein